MASREFPADVLSAFTICSIPATCPLVPASSSNTSDVFHSPISSFSRNQPPATAFRLTCVLYDGAGEIRTGQPRLRILSEASNFLFSKTSRPPLGPTHTFTQWLPGFFPGDEAAGALSLTLTSIWAQVMNEWSYTATPPAFFHGGTKVRKNQGNSMSNAIGYEPEYRFSVTGMNSELHLHYSHIDSSTYQASCMTDTGRSFLLR